MLWDVLIETLFPNRVSRSMEDQEITRLVARLREQFPEKIHPTPSETTDKGSPQQEDLQKEEEEQIQQDEEIMVTPVIAYREERVKQSILPRLSSDSDLFMSSRSTCCQGLTPSVTGRLATLDFLTSPDRATHQSCSLFAQQCNTTHLLSYQHTEVPIHEDTECSRIITEEDLAHQEMIERSDKSNSFVQTESDQCFKKTPVRKEIEVVLMEYLFEYAYEKLEDKDTLNSLDLASNYLNSRQNMMHKEDIVKQLMKDLAHQKGQDDFVKRQFEINSEILEIIPQKDTVKILLYQLRLVQAIALIYGHFVEQDMIKLVSLFSIIDDKSIKKILEPFAIKGYSQYKKSLHFKQLSKIIEKGVVKSVLFATASHLIDSLNNQTRQSVMFYSYFKSNGKFNDPKITCQRAQTGFDNLSIDLDSSDGH